MPAMCMRFWPAWVWLKARIDDGEFGRCTSATFTRLAAMPRWSGFFADGKRSGGAIVDLHIHDADFVYWCFGMPESVSSSGRVGETGAVDHVTTLYRSAKPPFGSEPQGRRQAARHVVAEGGWDQHDGFAFRMRYVAIFEGATADFDLTRDPQLVLCRGGKSEAVALEKLSGYDLQVRHLIDAVARGDKTTLATLEDAAAVTEMLDAERESVLSGHSVEIETRKTT
jgi:predicted dehydrogenase